MEKQIILSKGTVSRLLHDVKNIIKTPLIEHGIYYMHDDEDILKGYAVIIGPSDTLYFGGYYFFEFTFPPDYPHSPPIVKYCTNGENIRFNPNLYTTGKVCISSLNTWRGEQWTSCQTITSLLLSLCTLLCVDPLLNEPGISKDHIEFNNYNKIIEYKNIDIALLKMIQKKNGIYPLQFSAFHSILNECFIKNSANLELILKQKVAENPSIYNIRCNIYTMNVVIDYPKLYNDFLKTKHDLMK